MVSKETRIKRRNAEIREVYRLLTTKWGRNENYVRWYIESNYFISADTIETIRVTKDTSYPFSPALASEIYKQVAKGKLPKSRHEMYSPTYTLDL